MPAADVVLDPAGSPTIPLEIIATVDRIAAATEACLSRAGIPSVRSVDGTGLSTVLPSRATSEATAAYNRCTIAASRTSVAPAASLYLGDGTGLLDLVGPGWLRILGVILIVVATAFPVALLLGRRLTRPLEQLTATARRLEGGDLTARVQHGGTDEVATLAHAVNGLAASLERNEHTRRRMVSDIAHELRNPLVTLQGTIEAVQDGVYPATPETVGSLLDETEQLRRIVDDLADLALADAGALRLQLEPVDLVAIARAVTEAQLAAAAVAGVSVRVDAPDAVLASADATRTRQVLVNLVGNALRHTPPGGAITIAVRAAGPAAEITVTDTGEGIDEDDLTHIFDRFFRADASRSRATGGSGLGLTIASELVAAQHGTITAASRRGEGSCFTVALPSRAV